MGYNPWGHKESDTTEATEHIHAGTSYQKHIILVEVFIVYFLF